MQDITLSRLKFAEYLSHGTSESVSDYMYMFKTGALVPDCLGQS